ncbi:MAG: response regulator [Endomicrobiales bacterium]|jgi:CheY-like chemotaxis protein/sugar lactone lactonase YvrE
MAKILLIDDDAGMRQIMTRILVPSGHTVVTAEDGTGSLDICRQEHPDVVIADIDLPDMHGIEILSAIKKVNPSVPVIILTGISEIDAAVELVKNGAAAYLSKPFKISDFISQVNKILPSRTTSRVSAAVVAPPPLPVTKHVPLPLPQKKDMRVLVLSAVLAVCVAGGLFAFHWFGASPLKPVDYSIESANPSGIWSDGTAVWVSDWMQGMVYKYQMGKTVSMVPLKLTGVEPTGIAGDGNTIWVAYSFGKKILKYTAGEKTLSRDAEYASPGSSPYGLWYDGHNLWSLDFQEGKIYEHAMDASLTVIRSATIPAKNPCGVCMVGPNIFVADTATNRIYSIGTDRFSIQGVYQWPGTESAQHKLSSISWDGHRLWACFDGVSKLFSCRIKDLTKIRA